MLWLPALKKWPGRKEAITCWILTLSEKTGSVQVIFLTLWPGANISVKERGHCCTRGASISLTWMIIWHEADGAEADIGLRARKVMTCRPRVISPSRCLAQLGSASTYLKWIVLLWFACVAGDGAARHATCAWACAADGAARQKYGRNVNKI